MTTPQNSAGSLIREWRTRRRMSQLDLAMEAEISQRHLSFVESGRAAPSRDMVLHLAEQLSIPLRQRNQLLLAAGFAPSFTERSLTDASLAPAMAAVETLLRGHEPFPALAVDRHWSLVSANAAIAPFLADVTEPALLQPPVNVLRLSLHPGGIAPRIVNLAEWRTHLLERLKHQNDASGDPVLVELERELRGYPSGLKGGRPAPVDLNAIAHPLRMAHGDQVLSFISTITVFGTPLDVTLSELAIESFFPADEQTRTVLVRLANERAQKAFDAWRDLYNAERPHDGLKGCVPLDRYTPSPRSFCETVEVFDYPKGAIVRKVQNEGRVALCGYILRLSKAFGGKAVAFIPTGKDGVFQAFFRHQKIETVDLNLSRR